MKKIKILGAYAAIIAMVGAIYYFVDAPVLSANPISDDEYNNVEFDLLSEADKDAITAAKDKMKATADTISN